MNQNQSNFIDNYFTTNNLVETCKKTGISRQTGYNYLNNAEIIQEIKNRKQILLSETTNFFQSKLMDVSKTLIDIIEDPKTPINAKLQAINLFFNNNHKLTETTDIEEDIKEIKEKLSLHFLT